MDAALKRSANLGFILLAIGFLLVPGTWVFYLALVTGYAHGVQGLYLGYRRGRFKIWFVLAALASIYPLAMLPHILLVMLAAVFSSLHFVTDEFYLFKSRWTPLAKILFPGLFILLIGALIIFYRGTDKQTVLVTAAMAFFLGAVFFGRSIRTVHPAETGLLILTPTLVFAIAFLDNSHTSAALHLMGLMHFWSFYVEYFKRSPNSGRTKYLVQSISLFAVFASMGMAGWYFQNELALKFLDARFYFAWIIAHCILSFRDRDWGLLETSNLWRFGKTELAETNS